MIPVTIFVNLELAKNFFFLGKEAPQNIRTPLINRQKKRTIHRLLHRQLLQNGKQSNEFCKNLT